MKAIVTKYLPATDYLGARIKASTAGGLYVTIRYTYSGQEHDEAALALCAKLGWPGNLISGGMPDGTGNCYFFADSTPIVNPITAYTPPLAEPRMPIPSGARGAGDTIPH